MLGQGAPAASITLYPIRDAAIYEDAGGITANGAGGNLLAGRTNQATGSRRRSLLQFDFSGLPDGAVIHSATLRLELLVVSTANLAVSLHRLTSPWTTAGSDPAGNESAGVAALTGDTTWLHTTFSGSLWNAPGGDHVAVPSATQIIASSPGSYFWTSPALASDIQQWLAQPQENRGWLLRGDEVAPQTAKRFVSSDSPSLDLRPALTLEFSEIPEVSTTACCVLSLCLAAGNRARRRPGRL